jgi:hypothetical protein
MSDPLSIVLRHIALPDSLSERKTVLEALILLIKHSHPAFNSICAQINAIEKLQILQKELPLKFQPKAKR